MTKPSYEELAKRVSELEAECKRLSCVDEAQDELEAENLRVRGLLQRQWISVEERLPEPKEKRDWYLITDGEMYDVGIVIHGRFTGHRELEVTHWMPLPTFPQSSSLVPSGAESADIGKLEAADESGKVNRVDAGTEFSINSATPESVYKLIVGLKLCAYCKHTHTFQFDDIVDDDCPVVGCPCMHFLGSAETGGEKAEFFGIMECADGLYLCLGDKFVLDKFPKDNLSRQRCLSMKEDYEKAINDMLANFPRPSQNQTAPSGVEVAHEGTTADKSGLLPTQLPKGEIDG